MIFGGFTVASLGRGRVDTRRTGSAAPVVQPPRGRRLDVGEPLVERSEQLWPQQERSRGDDSGDARSIDRPEDRGVRQRSRLEPQASRVDEGSRRAAPCQIRNARIVAHDQRGDGRPFGQAVCEANDVGRSRLELYTDPPPALAEGADKRGPARARQPRSGPLGGRGAAPQPIRTAPRTARATDARTRWFSCRGR